METSLEKAKKFDEISKLFLNLSSNLFGLLRIYELYLLTDLLKDYLFLFVISNKMFTQF